MKALVTLLLILTSVSAAAGRTIELSCFDLTGFAAISSEAPLLGCVGSGQAMDADRPGFFSTYFIDLLTPRAMIMRFDLSQVPEGMQVTRAELVMPVTYQPQPEAQVSVFRVLVEWGTGVCEQFRMRRPEELPWAEPGGRGVGTDRAVHPTATAGIDNPASEVRVNVTADVALWYGDAASNHGWIIRTHEPNQWIRFASPIYSGREGWKLVVTYEPK